MCKVLVEMGCKSIQKGEGEAVPGKSCNAERQIPSGSLSWKLKLEDSTGTLRCSSENFTKSTLDEIFGMFPAISMLATKAQ